MNSTDQHFADLAFLSYLPAQQAENAYQRLKGLKAIAIHESESERDEGYVLLSGQNNSLVVAPRGSNDDLDWTQVNLHLWKSWRGGKTGFADAAATIWSRIRIAVMAHAEMHGNFSIQVTGHSKGGAAGFYLARTLHLMGLPVELYSYGMPRAASTHEAAQAWFKHRRVFHPEDLVPHLPPPILGYAHHGTPISTNGEATWANVVMMMSQFSAVKTLIKDRDWLTAHGSYSSVLDRLD